MSTWAILAFFCTLTFMSCKGSDDRTAYESTNSITRDSSMDGRATSGDPEASANEPIGDTLLVKQNTNNWKTYVNKEYGFSFSYPPGLEVREGFEEVHHLTNNWRAMATPKQQGAAVVSVPIARLTSTTSYPRYYDVDFRVGVASEMGTACAALNGESTLGTIVINGATFNQFEFGDAGMMQYMNGISYRTGHEGRCFAIEQIRSGSSYRDASSKSDLPESALDSIYFIAGKIVKTFRFLR